MHTTVVYKNKWESQRIHKRNNRKQRATKHYRKEAQDVIWTKKKPVKQRKCYKRFLSQRRRKKIYKQLSFDLDDFVFNDKKENYKRIQIKASIKTKYVRSDDEYNISSMYNNTYDSSSISSLFDKKPNNLRCDSYPPKYFNKYRLGYHVSNYECYDIRYINSKDKKKTLSKQNEEYDEIVPVTENSLKHIISEKTLSPSQKIHVYPLLNKYAMQRLINKQQRNKVKMVYTTSLCTRIQNKALTKSQLSQPHKSENKHDNNSIHEIYGDEIIQLCSIFSFISVFCGYHSSSKTHSDVINLCISYAGMQQNIFPFAQHNILSKLNDLCNYNKIRNNPIDCFDFDTFDQYLNNLSNGRKEIFICLLLNDINSNTNKVLFKDLLPMYYIQFRNNVSSISSKPKVIKTKVTKQKAMTVENISSPKETVKMFLNLDKKWLCWCGCGQKIPGTHKGYKYKHLKKLRVCVVNWNKNKFKQNPRKPSSKTYVRKGWWHFHEQMTKIPVHKRGFSQLREDTDCGHRCCIHLRRKWGNVWKIIRLKKIKPGYLEYKRGVWYGRKYRYSH